LDLYQTGRSKTGVKPHNSLYEAMAIYAPASDNNNPKKYAEFIGKKLGIDPYKTPIHSIDKIKWAEAISIMEGNKSYLTGKNKKSPINNSKTTAVDYTPRNPNFNQGVNFNSKGKSGLNSLGEQGRYIGNLVADMLGYKPTYNSIYRTAKNQQQYVDQGVGAKNSWHLTGNAIDINPKDWNKLTPEQQKYLKTNFDYVFHNNHHHIEPKGSPKNAHKHHHKYGGKITAGLN